MKKVQCPLCHQNVKLLLHAGKLVYEEHYIRNWGRCEYSLHRHVGS